MTNLILIGRTRFPESSGLRINMMPFIIGDNNSIPQEYRQYCSMIQDCGVETGELGKTGYLSIQESVVEANKYQRRPGIHTDGHGVIGWGWGRGEIPNGKRIRGLYIASSVENSCRAWDIEINTPGPMGDCERYRTELEEEEDIVMRSHYIYWLTDRCPHESLPMKKRENRQWFRLVTSAVDIWYQDHSTKNRLGIKPDCEVISGNKFS